WARTSRLHSTKTIFSTFGTFEYHEMKSKYRAIILTAVVVLIAGFMMKDALFQPGIQALPGGFDETAFVRNEQNKGGIIRVYALSVSDPQQADYLTCGNLMPHNE